MKLTNICLYNLHLLIYHNSVLPNSPDSMPAEALPAYQQVKAFIKGKSLSATRLAGGAPSLQFNDNGAMYGKNGNNGGGSDSGKWRIEDGKLCMPWQRWEYEGCG